MIYSKWNQAGFYDIYEDSKQHGIGNDFGNPIIPRPPNLIGTAAQDCGRNPPTTAKYLGRSNIPQGVIIPSSNSFNFNGLGEFKNLKMAEYGAIFATFICLGAFVYWQTRD